MKLVDVNVLLYAINKDSAQRPGDDHWRILRSLLTESGTAGNLTSDAHLAALAIENGAELYSFDRDFGRFAGLRWRSLHQTRP